MNRIRWLRSMKHSQEDMICKFGNMILVKIDCKRQLALFLTRISDFFKKKTTIQIQSIRFQQNSVISLNSTFLHIFQNTWQQRMCSKFVYIGERDVSNWYTQQQLYMPSDSKPFQAVDVHYGWECSYKCFLEFSCILKIFTPPKCSNS